MQYRAGEMYGFDAANIWHQIVNPLNVSAMSLRSISNLRGIAWRQSHFSRTVLVEVEEFRKFYLFSR